MPARDWWTVPVSIWHRLYGRQVVEPWLTPAAIRYLARLLAPTWHVFEFGSGYSTPWLARRCGTLVSVEHDPRWHEQIERLLGSSGMVLLRPIEDFPQAMTEQADASFDLVIVDGAEAEDGHRRLACAEAARPKIRPGGYLMLDDSDRDIYRSADSILAGWSVLRFAGWRKFPLHAIETSFYRKPL
jgi:predicted O-methyltransferase YrrM